MAEYRGFDFLDFLVVLTKWRKFLLILFISTCIVSYLAIYFFIDEEFESTALILPSEDTGAMGGITGLMKNLKDLPFGLGGKSKSEISDVYLVIIYSRTNLEDLINKFNLLDDYGIESMEKGVKILSKKITAEVTDEDAFEITVRSVSPAKAVSMVNYIIELLNNKVIELNTAKSRENRIFLENRYKEINYELSIIEDSLQRFQEITGLLEAEEQVKLIATAYTELETEIFTKRVKLEIMETIYGKDSPQSNTFREELFLLESKFNEMKTNQTQESFLLSTSSLPLNMKIFIRLFRNVEIYHKILEFIVPLYEQAKLEEQKDIPVLQVIDFGNLPEKKAYPPRLLMTAVITVLILFLSILFLILAELVKNTENEKMKYIFSSLGSKRHKI